MRVLRVVAPVLVVGVFGLVAAGAWASVTPGWECIPTTANADVVSGGTGSVPSCAGGTTAVLAPTYVSSGVGGKPTVQFAAVNVQILNGAGSTDTANGTGNLVLGYDELPGTQSGSHDLVLGEKQTFTRWGELVGGYGNNVTGGWATAFGYGNKASGSDSLVSGEQNTVAATASAALGGFKNVVSSGYSALLGGCSNVVGTTAPTVASVCSNTTSYNHDFATISGGSGNQATGIGSSLTGGQFNLTSDPFSSIAGGCEGVTGSATALTDTCGTTGYESILGGVLNRAKGQFSSVSAGLLNQANGYSAAVSGGDHNTAGGSDTGSYASVTGGGGNFANGDESAISGGQYNATADDNSVVAGGCDNLAGSGTAPTGDCVNSDSGLKDGHDTILGGFTNATTGLDSSISGGQSNSATGNFSSILGGDAISLSKDNGVSPAGLVSSLTGPTSFALSANSCGSFILSDGDLQVGDVPLFAYTTTPPTGNMLFTPGAVLTAGKATYTVCNDSSSSGSFNGSVHIIAFRG